MGMRLQRLLSDDPERLDAGQWLVDAFGNRHVSCPGCGNVAMLGEQYLNDAEGRVAPSWACTRCPFWEYLLLGDWGEP